MRDRPITDDDWGDLFARMGAPAEKVIRQVLKKPESESVTTPAPNGKVFEPFEHPCETCGDFAYFGYKVKLREEKWGNWYCNKHRPDRKAAGQ